MTKFVNLRKKATGYHAKAVHFDGATFLSTPALSCVDGPAFSAVLWSKSSSPGVIDNPGVGCEKMFWSSDPLGNYVNWSAAYEDINGAGGGTDNAFFTLDGNTGIIEPHSHFTFDVWGCYILSVETNFSTGNKKYKVYFGDTDVTWYIDADGPSSDVFFNGLSFYVGTDTYSNPPFTYANHLPDGRSHTFLGDMADFRIFPGISLLNGSGDISLATRRLFIDANGKPVDPAVATSALGTLGAVLLSGDHTAFPVNQGTGGSFTL